MRISSFPRVRIAVTAGVAVTMLAVAGCSDNGSDESSTSKASGTSATQSEAGSAQSEAAPFNEADVSFLQMMYPHHEQAVEMAAMVDGRTTNQEVIELATAIEAAQGPEMEQMTNLLAEWGQPAPDSGDGHMSHGSGQMSGMMSDEQMTALAGKNGPEFDTMWLTMMIDHHEGAVDMAETELADGENTDATNMATAIIDAQQAEIITMNDMSSPK